MLHPSRLLAAACLVVLAACPLDAADLEVSDEGVFLVLTRETGLKASMAVVIRKDAVLSTEVHEVEGIPELYVTTRELVPHEGAAVHRVHRFRVQSIQDGVDVVERIARFASEPD